MNKKRPQKVCSDCDSTLDRRGFLHSVAGASLAGIVVPSVLGMRMVHGAPSPKSAAETVVAQFYQTLSAEQKKELCFPFDHELRRKVNANWHVTKPTIGQKFYTNEQRALIEEIVKKVTSADGYERLLKQMEYDDGGLGAYSVAVFGEPGNGKFQWELTGRHLTLRADGDTVDKAAFGGPIVYGHGEETAKDNLFHYQTKQVNEVFKALDAKQAEKALIKMAPAEANVPLQGADAAFPGIAVKELSADQRQLVEATLKTLLGPYRQDDVEEVMTLLKGNGGVEGLHLAFYQQGDLDNDKVWDIWRVEGPGFVWHFRGAPHVHAYINIGVK